MLLPSALPCEAQSKSTRQTRPKLVTFASYQPQPQQPAQSAQSALQASCRALQAILGGGSLNAPSHQLQRQPSPLRYPLHHRAQFHRVLKRSPLKPQPPRGANKRRRDEFECEDEDEEMIADCEKENIPYEYCTPKRQRRAPLAMPLGLSAADFEALEQLSYQQMELDMPDAEISENAEQYWTAEDDRILVETVLEKLNVSRRTWNDCAKIMGKDKATLGMRWRVLVGEGNVGLRRGRRTERTDLDIRSW